jgi:hypothetical protein
MQQEVLTRAAELAALLRTNAALRARERVLQRAIEGSGVQLAVMARQLGGGVSDAPSDGGSSSSVDRLSHASPEVAAPTWLGAPPAPPAVAGLGAALGGRPGLAGAGPPERAPAGAHQLLPPLLSDPARVLERLCGAEPLMAAVPRELLEAIGSAFRRFVAAHRAAQACRGPGAEAAHAQALALFRTAHELVRTGNMACLLLRSQLRCTNFETMAFGSAPHGHWERVVAGAGGLAALSPEAQADLVEAWRLAGSSMVRGGRARLLAAGASSPPRSNGVASSSSRATADRLGGRSWPHACPRVRCPPRRPSCVPSSRRCCASWQSWQRTAPQREVSGALHPARLGRRRRRLLPPWRPNAPLRPAVAASPFPRACLLGRPPTPRRPPSPR